MLIPLSLRRISSLAPSYSTARRVLQNLPPGLVCRRSGSALSPSDQPRPVLILIDAVSTLIVAPYRRELGATRPAARQRTPIIRLTA
jgi:hypothetical protein